MKIKKGDTVEVISGKDRGKKGKVERVIPKDCQVVVSGVNLTKRHRKAKSANEPGGIIELSAPLDISNIMLVCPRCNIKTRVGFGFDAQGRKYRKCKKCGEFLDRK